MANGMFLEFDTRHHAVVNLLGLGTILVLPIERVRLLRLQKQGAITVSPSRACYLAHFRLEISAAKAAVLPSCACNLAHLGPDLHSKCRCPRIINNFGTGGYQMPSSKLILIGDCVVQKSEVAKL